MFVLIYFAVFGAGTGYMLRLIRIGPGRQEGAAAAGPESGPMRPLSAAGPPRSEPDGH